MTTMMIMKDDDDDDDNDYYYYYCYYVDLDDPLKKYIRILIKPIYTKL